MSNVVIMGGVVMALTAAACGDGSGAAVNDAAMPDTGTAQCPGGKTMFLNRGGGTYTAGTDNATTNTTTILMSGTFDVAAFPFGDPTWGAIKTCVTAKLSLFNVTVTDVDPGTAPHHEIVFTSTYSTWPGGVNGVSSVSSNGCPVGGAHVMNGIAFVFSTTIGDKPADLCEAAVSQVASEIAGLDHSLDCHDFLGLYQPPCGEKAFLDQEVMCGESTARACACTSAATQNSFAAMSSVLCH